MEISLSGQKWQVKGYWPWVPVKEKSMETGQTLQGVTDWLDAAVPGGVHYDLWRAGLIENPYFGKNSLHCEWVENRWWMYRTAFPIGLLGEDAAKKRVTLICRGLDYEARVFLNDTFCGMHRGMYDAFCADVTGLLKEENKLVVIFSGVPAEMGQIGHTSRTSTQKSRFNYKWDFSTRLVNIGFWQDVVLEIEEELEIRDIHLDTDHEEGAGRIFFSGRLAGSGKTAALAGEKLALRLTVDGPFDRRCGDVKLLSAWNEAVGDDRRRTAYSFAEEGEMGSTVDLAETQESRVYQFALHKDEISEVLRVEKPQLWQPNGSGRPLLYRVKAELLRQGRAVWNREMYTGIRSLRLVPNEDAPADALPYTFVLNGEKTWIRGVNLTPLDHLYGNVSRKHYEELVTAMINEGVNLVRVWGGGLIEREDFYELCDENGILIWQEFIQSSSGIDNRPSELPEFLELLKRAAAAAVKQKRNHVSLAVYSGGNELMEAPDRPCSLSNKNIAMLKKIVDTYDGRRTFLPTSASGPREFVTRQKGVSHDVHGNWRYEGDPGHYELYGESDNLFHSEFGMDAVSCVKSLKKFLPGESLRPTPMSSDPFWQHHGEWWGTYFRDCSMFGPIGRTETELERFVACSQYMQSEGLRFILEADRKRAYQNSGTIIWQLNEPWPNASCTSLIDYYGETKPAYYQVKRAYEPCHISLDYRTLTYSEKETVSFDVYVSNSGEAVHGCAEVLVRSMEGKTLWRKELAGTDGNGQTSIAANRGQKIGTVSFLTPDSEVFLVTARIFGEDRRISENTYLFSTQKEAPFAALRRAEGKVILEQTKVEKLEDGRMQAELVLYNAGTRAVLEAGVSLTGDSFLLLGDDNCVTLFPGERRKIRLLLIPKAARIFEEQSCADEKDVGFVLRWL